MRSASRCATSASRSRPSAGITIAIEESYGPRDSDMTPQLTNIRNKAGVLAVVNTGLRPGSGDCDPQLSPARISSCRCTKAMAWPPSSSSSSLALRPKACAYRPRRFSSPTSFPTTIRRNLVVSYSRTYEQKTGGQPVSTFGGHAYDGLMILVEAMQARQELPTRPRCATRSSGPKALSEPAAL